MSRKPRIDLGGYVYHVLNRANDRVRIFHAPTDYKDFELLLAEMCESFGMRILAYTIMPNHWHMLLNPVNDGDMQRSLQWLGTSHARRHHERKGTVGHGHLYQGRYKTFLVEEDMHLLTVLKYIEHNPVRAKLAKRAEDWRWGSTYRRINGTVTEKRLLAESPVDLPRNYLRWVNEQEPSEEIESLRHSVNKGMAFGNVPIS